MEQIQPIVTAELEKSGQVREKYQSRARSYDTMIEMFTELRALREATMASLGEILTAEQMSELEKIQQEAQEKRRQSGAGASGNQR